MTQDGVVRKLGDSPRSGVRIFTIERDNNPDLRFAGTLFAEVRSDDRASDVLPPGSSFVPTTEKVTCLRLYKTHKGNLIAVREEIANPLRNHVSTAAAVCHDEDAVKEFFGFGPLAKALYTQCGIEFTVDVE